MINKHLKFGWYKLRYAISIKCTLDSKTLKKKGELKTCPYNLTFDYMLKW